MRWMQQQIILQWLFYNNVNVVFISIDYCTRQFPSSVANWFSRSSNSFLKDPAISNALVSFSCDSSDAPSSLSAVSRKACNTFGWLEICSAECAHKCWDDEVVMSKLIVDYIFIFCTSICSYTLDRYYITKAYVIRNQWRWCWHRKPFHMNLFGMFSQPTGCGLPSELAPSFESLGCGGPLLQHLLHFSSGAFSVAQQWMTTDQPSDSTRENFNSGYFSIKFEFSSAKKGCLIEWAHQRSHKKHVQTFFMIQIPQVILI